MADAELAARLTAHEHAFEGLLDLIPAKFYNPEDAANQWNKRKQTKEEQVKAKRAKLDPAQNSRQVKRVEEGAVSSTTDAPVAQSRKAKVKQPKAKQTDKAKATKAGGNGSADAKSASKVKAKSGKAIPKDLAVPPMTTAPGDDDKPSSIDASPLPESTSTEADLPNQPDPNRNIADLRAKLAAKIEALRTRRKAPGTEVEGAPRSREAILEVRRKKEEARAAKKKLEKQARKDAALEMPQDEEVKSESDSASDEEDDDEAHPTGGDAALSYGKLTLPSGESVTSTFETQGARKRKHQDPKSALEAALNKRKRISGLDDEKKQAIKDSDAWHKALLQADGEKLKDDVGLLKKAVKRQEATKKKSEKEWKARLSSIAMAKKNKQKTREKNLKERREAKGQKGGHKKTKPVGHKGKGKGAPGKKKGF
ncbi:surfeit locus protein 6-domain-containing protein [Protomyces lactucae-debilis]|uniref:Surfeit locus protein 6-domain-containing protein n=1 Tax=Protomyces lactucae-debilis TaxID=2754530 RepID=A0A1Y2FKD7_PROLT|nr:surfeit locus protein 6-domain-containing protein [Protomyces lactucae-debilis]ORY84418.1 surfeit locus protein 6-domain-containing protein [Protomyces lactucae-debilis]